MWHVKYVEVIGTQIFGHEYVAGYVGNGLVRHALDKNLRTLCQKEYSGRRKRLPTHFDTKRLPITCKRCLWIINANRNLDYVTNWQEE